MIEHGTAQRGEQATNVKLTKDVVLAVRAIAGMTPQRKLAMALGVTQQTISDIQTRRRWGWLKGELKPDAAMKFMEGLAS